MKIIPYSEILPTHFNDEPARGVAGRVAIGKADGAANFCMRVFELEDKGYTPCHRHPWEHEIFIHKGYGEVLCHGDWKPVAPGTAIFIPGNEEHQIRNASNEPLVFICLIPSGVDEL